MAEVGFQDARIWPVLAELSACLCGALGDDASPCFCGVLVGQQIPIEYAGDCDDCGAAYVRVVSSFMSTDNFPAPDSAPTCAALTAYSVAVGIVRCAPVGYSNGEPPTSEEVALSNRRALADMDAIRKAIRCCFVGKFDDEIEYVLGEFQPASDGMLGGEQFITIREI